MAKAARTVPTDPFEIPAFLLVKNRVPPKKLNSLLGGTGHHAESERQDWRKPKGTSWQEWDAYLALEQVRKRSADAERFTELRATAAPRAKAARPDGLFDAHHFAKVLGVEAKIVRRALRTLKEIQKPTYGWYFPKSDEVTICAIVRKFLARMATPKPRKQANATPAPRKPAAGRGRKPAAARPQPRKAAKCRRR